MANSQTFADRKKYFVLYLLWNFCYFNWYDTNFTNHGL